MSIQLPKRAKRQVRELAAKLEEIERRAALQPLAADFTRWENGEIDSFDLKDLSIAFTKGRCARYLRYDTPDLVPHVAYAIATGVLDRAAVPAEVLDALAGLIEMMASWAGEDEEEQTADPPTEAE